jgi:hypothetical protein
LEEAAAAAAAVPIKIIINFNLSVIKGGDIALA